MNSVFGHGHLRLYLLNLLNEHPQHGYELIQALSDRFGGTYSPSAGTIYPRLAKLEEDGLVTKTTDGRKTVYEITDAGRAELESRRAELDSIEDNVMDSVRVLADGVRAGVNEAMRSLRADLASAARGASQVDGRASSATPPSPEPTSGDGWSVRTPGAESGAAPDGEAAPDDGAPGADPRGSAWASAPRSEQQRQGNADSLREAEAALSTFRAMVRSELRKHAAKGVVSQQAVRTFTADLARIQAELRENLSAK